MIAQALAGGHLPAASFPEFVLSIPTVVWSVFAGVVIAVIAVVYNKRVIGSFVRFLLKSGAVTEETAIRLSDTDYRKKRTIRSAIAHNYTLRKYLCYAEEKEAENAEKPPQAEKKKARPSKETILSRRYYIPEEKTFAAEELYSAKGSNPVAIGILLLVLLAIAILCLFVIPYVVGLFEQLFAGGAA